MDQDGYKGFRHGVRQLKCAGPTTLAEAVAAQLAHEKEDSALNSLELIEMGAVYVNDERCMNPARALMADDRLRIHTAPRRFEAPADLAGRILAENEDTLLVEKPAGLPAELQIDNTKENLLAFLEDLRGQKLYLTHRLAADSEGLILVAKSPEAQARIKQAFAEGRVRRKYVAYVETAPVVQDSAPFRVNCSEERAAPTQLISEERVSWQVVGAPLPKTYRLEIEFTQARPKEIREAFAKMGTPIIGDIALGSRIELKEAVTQKSAIAFRALALEL